jgi:ankyrin repeat protein
METVEQFIALVRNGDLEEIHRRLDADPSLASVRGDDGLSVVLEALYRGHNAAAEMLLARGPELNLPEAAATGNTDRVKELLAAGDDVNAFSSDGWTPLHLAVFFGHADTALPLLDAGADQTALSRNGLRVIPLQSALAQRQVEAATILIHRGSDVNGEPSHGWTPLHYCAAYGLEDVAKLLLEKGADVNHRRVPMGTPLAAALEAGHTNVAELLRAHGGLEVSPEAEAEEAERS